MSSEPLVSVVLPVYNGEADVGRAIRSIQDQTYGNWELLIRNDGSTDRSLEICQEMALQDRRIAVSSSGRNLGLARTMNILVSCANGEFIAVQEHDDISVPERLEWEVALLREYSNIGLVSGIAAWVDDQGETFALFPGMLQRGEQFSGDRELAIEHLLIEQSKIVNAACIFRRDLLDGLSPPFDERAQMSIDWQFFVHLAHRTQLFGIPRVLVHAKRGSQNRSLTTQTELKFDEARRCIRLLYERYGRDVNSPIDHRIYRMAMATQLTIEGRTYGGFKGLGRLIRALAYNPTNYRARRSLRELCGRAVRRGGRILGVGR